MTHSHDPILLPNVLEALAPMPGRLIVDGTLGAGGHAEALLKAGAEVIGLDQDQEAIIYASRRLAEWRGPRQGKSPPLRIIHTNFRCLSKVIDQHPAARIDGLLLDLGISSMQLDSENRGFSFQRGGPLDMRMNQGGGLRAIDIVNHSDLDELTNIIHKLGEEPQDVAHRLALAITTHRKSEQITTTGQLASLVERGAAHLGKRHPATRLFQALRIAVNDELGALASFLSFVPRILRRGGRVAIISFHSLEDVVVKRFFHNTMTCDKSVEPASGSGRTLGPQFRELTGGTVSASNFEQRINPRARSAKLRAYERL